MIHKRAVEAVRRVVTHARCPDGYATAIVVREVLPQAALTFLAHGTPESRTLLAEPGLLFCDIAPPPARAAEFLEAGTLVLDHHESARSLVETFVAKEQGVFADAEREPGVSGAVLAYRHVYEALAPRDDERAAKVRAFAELAGIRDTFVKDDPRWRAACAQAEALFFFGENSLSMRLFDDGSTDAARFEEMGKLLLAKRETAVQKAVNRSYRTGTERTRIAIVHDHETVSDAAELIGDAADLVVAFHYAVKDVPPSPDAPNARRQALLLELSLRSQGKVDCAAFAKKSGGGGHVRAAGCAVEPASRPPHELIVELVRAYESDLGA